MTTLNVRLTLEYGPEGGSFNVLGSAGFQGGNAEAATLLAIAVDRILTTLDLSPEQFLDWMLLVRTFPKEGVALDAAEAAKQAAQEADP